MACVRMRVVDRSVLQLIRMWLETPVYERGGGRRTYLREDLEGPLVYG